MEDARALADLYVPLTEVNSHLLGGLPALSQAEVGCNSGPNRAPSSIVTELIKNTGSNASGGELTLTMPPPFASSRIAKVPSLQDGECSVPDSGALKSLVGQADVEKEEANDYFKMAHGFLTTCKAVKSLPDLESAISLFQYAARNFPAGDPQLKECHNNLAAAFLTRFNCTGDTTNIQKAFISLTSALETAGATSLSATESNFEGKNPNEAMFQALKLLTQFHQAVDLQTLENAITLYHKALSLQGNRHPQRWRTLLELSEAYLLAFYHTGNAVQVDEAIAILREGSMLRPNLSLHLCAALHVKAHSMGHGMAKLLCVKEASRAFTDAMNAHQTAQELVQPCHDLYKMFQQSGDVQYINAAIENLRQATSLSGLFLSHIGEGAVLVTLAAMLYTRCRERGNFEDLAESIDKSREGLALFPSSHPGRDSLLKILANAVQMRYEQKGNFNDIEEAIQLHREVLQASPHSDYGGSLNNLGCAVYARYKQKGDFNDLEIAIGLYKEALALHPISHPDRDISLNNVANAVLTRYGQEGNLIDLQEVIGLHREALALRPVAHPDRRVSLNNLALALQVQYTHKGDFNDLEEAIVLCREAYLLQSKPHVNSGSILGNLASVVRARYEQRGEFNDLEEAVQLHREVLALHPISHPGRGGSLNNLANAVYNCYKQNGDFDDLEEAIGLYREALALHPTPHPSRDTSLNNLGFVVKTRYKHKGDFNDIQEAIGLHTEALALRPTSHPEHNTSLRNLADVVHTRFEWNGDLNDLEEAIGLYREALTLCPAPHPNRGISLNNLSTAIMSRYSRKGDFNDVVEAIELYKEALALRPTHHPFRDDSLGNLSNALIIRYNQKGDFNDLEEAIGLHREVLILRPTPHPARDDALNNLANVLQTRCRHREDFDDLEEAIGLHREALTLRPISHPHHGSSLNNLADAVHIRYKQKRDTKDLDEACELLEKAIAILTPPHPFRGTALTNFAHRLTEKYENAHLEDDLHAAISLFQEASTYASSSPLQRLRHTHDWAQKADQYGHTSALFAYHATINLLPHIAALHLDIVSRLSILSTLQGSKLVSESSNCAINQGEYNGAVELLEASRSIFWSQALHLRTPLYDLERVNHNLALKLKQLARELELASFRDSSRSMTINSQKKAIAIELEGTRCQQLNDDWEATVAHVRELPGFKEFMRPKSIVTLRQAAKSGPIVILTGSTNNCSALLVTFAADVQHVPLPQMSLDKAHNYAHLAKALFKSGFELNIFLHEQASRGHALEQSELVTRLIGRREEEAVSINDVFRSLLVSLWEEIVKPVLEALKFEKSLIPSRLWWCPTGPFSFLPVHAAGIYPGDCVSNYIISSYTPTVAALLDQPIRSADPFRMMTIIQPDTAGYSPLPGCKEELTNIVFRVPSQWLTTLGDTNEATIHAALVHLPQSSIAHFACHGIQNMAQPLNSGLILSDGCLRISEIMRGPAATNTLEDTKRAMSLAFLSACETAMGDNDTPDESIHLAATLLFAKFSSVVATMWTMQDDDGPKIADKFYEHLFKNCDPNPNPSSLPDLTKAAEALHYAVAELRKDPRVSFRRWVSFVHYGL